MRPRIHTKSEDIRFKTLSVFIADISDQVERQAENNNNNINNLGLEKC